MSKDTDTKLECNNPRCQRKNDEEPSFVLHTYHIEEHDYQMDADGNVGEYLTEEQYEGRATGVIHSIRCEYCDGIITVPQKWMNKNPAMWDPNLHIHWAIIQNNKIPKNVAKGEWMQ
ncbi:MAG: hypothetical protein LDL06_03210 [Candidatus Nitrosotenuis sp.]|nr:hypothetical protein [Candidatus Nitrosotenuis sp.]